MFLGCRENDASIAAKQRPHRRLLEPANRAHSAKFAAMRRR
jgi:hypothetical protein